MYSPHAVGRLARAVSVVSFLAAGAGSAAQPASDYGVLVMAHGGSPAWNADVLAAVQPLRETYPLEVAFGMADPATLQAAVARLEARGARRIGVVRLFVSGESFLDRTRHILGLTAGAPAPPTHAHGRGGHSMALWQIDTDSEFALSTEGLADAPEMGDVLADRARGLSTNATREEVLILAHGPGDDDENERWIAALDRRADAVRGALPFADVRVATLREDWPEKRAQAEAEVRAYIAAAARRGHIAIVIPFRVSGFGDYVEVLEGLDYSADGRGLIPHEALTRWIERQARELGGAVRVGL